MVPRIQFSACSYLKLELLPIFVSSPPLANSNSGELQGDLLGALVQSDLGGGGMCPFPFKRVVSSNSLDFAFSLDVAVPQGYEELPESSRQNPVNVSNAKPPQAQQLRMVF